jgi:myo-inositol 2-dehydrogenase/D-chiro-inositol 1-dehydrogenase
MQYHNGVMVNIIHSWVAPGKFNDEYTRLIGVKGGIDFNSGVFSYRPDLKKPDRSCHEQQGEINSTLLALQNFLAAVRSHSQPVATVDHGRNAVIACLLMRQAVYSKRPVELNEILS